MDQKSKFEENYLSCRRLEGRIHPDELVRHLPKIPRNHPHYGEWRKREWSLKALQKHLSEKEGISVLEVGCGNGWLLNGLMRDDWSGLGVDTNEVEIKQAKRVFTQPTFIYGNILDDNLLTGRTFDIIVLASVIQYFPDLDLLIKQLMGYLSNSGEIHILDSPFYSTQEEAAKARNRTQNYYRDKGSDMANYYYHHQLSELAYYPIILLHQPKSIVNRIINSLIGNRSPFPWIMIRKEP